MCAVAENLGNQQEDLFGNLNKKKMKQQKIKRKKIIKYFNKLAKLLPVVYYKALQKLSSPVYTNEAGDLYTEEMETAGEKRVANWAVITEHPVNHKRRMMKLWDQFEDIRAVDAYMRLTGKMTLFPNEEELKKENETIREEIQ